MLWDLFAYIGIASTCVTGLFLLVMLVMIISSVDCFQSKPPPPLFYPQYLPHREDGKPVTKLKATHSPYWTNRIKKYYETQN